LQAIRSNPAPIHGSKPSESPDSPSDSGLIFKMTCALLGIRLWIPQYLVIQESQLMADRQFFGVKSRTFAKKYMSNQLILCV
jgi:hypothetical protein